MLLNELKSINGITNIRTPFTDFGIQKGEPFSIYAKNNVNSVNLNTELSIEKAPEEDMEVIAHRGYCVDAPENTLPAYIEAAENGFDKVECDVSWTKDGVPVLLHDTTINRTARHKNGWKLFFSRKCSDMKYKDLLKLDFGIWKGKEYKGTKIPTFSEFADCCSENGLSPYVELKQDSKFDLEKAKILVDAIKEAGLEDKVTWISFNPEYLKMINQLMPDCRLGYLSSDKPSAKTIATLQSLKTDDNEVFLDVKSTVMDKASSEMVEKAGFSFEAWTVDDESELDKLQDYDCKGITTNTLTESDVDKYLED